MDLPHIMQSVFVFIVLFFEGVSSLSFSVSQIPSSPYIAIGNNQVQFVCRYTVDSGDTVFTISWQKEITVNNFQSIATFFPPNSPNDASFTTTALGDSFKNRSTLSKPSANSLTATLTVNSIDCEDAGLYRCFINYVTAAGVASNGSELTLVTAAPGEAPYAITQSSGQTEIEEGDTVTFTCTANIGKPLGKIRWWIYRSAVQSASELMAPAPTTPTVVPGVCEYNVTSTLSVQFTKNDNQAAIRCTIDQELITSPPMPEDKPYKQITGINVFYKVRAPVINKMPNANEYQVGTNLLTLRCTVDGNPNPSTATNTTVNKFTWYYKPSAGDNETMADSVIRVTSNKATLTLTNLIESQQGIYICEAQNGFKNQIYTERSEITIRIVKTTTTSSTTTPATSSAGTGVKPTSKTQTGNEDTGLGGGGIAGIVIGVLVVLIVVIVLIVCLVKGRHEGGNDSIDEPPEKPRNNQDLSFINRPDIVNNDKNSAFYQGNQYEKNLNKDYNKDLQYADLTFDDKPRSRKPIQMYDIDNNQTQDQSPYSQVMMPSV